MSPPMVAVNSCIAYQQMKSVLGYGCNVIAEPMLLASRRFMCSFPARNSISLSIHRFANSKKWCV